MNSCDSTITWPWECKSATTSRLSSLRSDSSLPNLGQDAGRATDDRIVKWELYAALIGSVRIRWVRIAFCSNERAFPGIATDPTPQQTCLSCAKHMIWRHNVFCKWMDPCTHGCLSPSHRHRSSGRACISSRRPDISTIPEKETQLIRA